MKKAKRLIEFARELRRNATEVEQILWFNLRAKRFEGLKFRRQQTIGPYIVDFACFKKKIIIELDGSQHLAQQQKDYKRDKWLEAQGFRIIRIWNNEFLKNPEGVFTLIFETCQKPLPRIDSKS